LITTYAGDYRYAEVTKRMRDDDDRAFGRRHQNPKLDTRMYQVEMDDGAVMEYSANLVAQNLYLQVDEQGKTHQIFKEIVDYNCEDPAVLLHHTNRKNKTTIGWHLLVEWCNGSTSWVRLIELKASNPIETAEYAYTNRIIDEPAFAWWAKDVLRKRDRIVGKLKTRYWRTTHKFGVQLPHSVEEALKIDSHTRTNHWRTAIEKEMTNVRPAFQRWDGTVEQASNGKSLVGYQRIRCHMIFDVKMDNLARKARFVAGGHTTETPASITYSSVVSRDSVQIAFLLAALNGLDVCVADVGNAYLNADCREKIWTVAGPEFGSDAGSVMIVTKALYGLKSSGAAWRALFASTLIDLGFKGSYADPDVWIRPSTIDGISYYEMILVYVNDILCISKDTQRIMHHISKIYRLKEGSVKAPDRYLGANIGLWTMEGGRKAWSMSAKSYIKSAVSNLESNMDRTTVANILPSKSYRPFKTGYRPEIDVSPVLPPLQALYYQGLIGVLRWICELGRMDILTEVSMLSSHNAMPRQGHLYAAMDIFSYLKSHQSAAIVFNDAVPNIDERRFKRVDWSDIYGNVEEALPPNMPTPMGFPVHMYCFVDADHAGNLVTRRSHTGIVIFLNSPPIGRELDLWKRICCFTHCSGIDYRVAI
jgi:hypothetical protein